MYDEITSHDRYGNRHLNFSNLQEVRGWIPTTPLVNPGDHDMFVGALDELGGLARPLTDVPADRQIVRDLLNGLKPTLGKSTHRSLARLRKTIGRILRLTAIERIPWGREIRPSSEWQRLLAEPTLGSSDRIILDQLTRWLTAYDIAPNHVEPRDLQQFADDLVQTTKPEYLRQRFTQLCNAWDRAVRNIGCWPQVLSAIELNNGYYALPWSAYPTSLIKAIDQHFENEEATDPTDIQFSRSGSTWQRKQREYIKLHLHALVDFGHSPNSFIDLQTALAPELLYKSVEYRINQKDGRASASFYNSVSKIASIAKRRLSLSSSEMQVLKEAVALSRPKTFTKSKETLKSFLWLEEPGFCIRFSAAPSMIVKELSQRNDWDPAFARMCRNAIAADLMITMALTPDDLVRLSIGDNIIRNSWGYEIFLAERHQRQSEQVRLPKAVGHRLDVYVERARPLLASDQNSGILFPGFRSPRMHPDYLARQAITTMERVIGRRITAFRFRLLSSGIYLKQRPKDLETVRRFLGWKSTERVRKTFKSILENGELDRMDDWLSQH